MFLGQVVWVAVPFLAPIWSRDEVQTDLALFLNDLAATSDHACSVLSLSRDRPESCVLRYSIASRLASVLCDFDLLLVAGSDRLQDAVAVVPSGVEVCTGRSAFVDYSEILVAHQDGEISAAPRDDEVLAVFVGPLDSVVSFVADVAVSDQVVLDLVVRVLDLEVPVLDLDVPVFDLVEDWVFVAAVFAAFEVFVRGDCPTCPWQEGALVPAPEAGDRIFLRTTFFDVRQQAALLHWAGRILASDWLPTATEGIDPRT